MDHEKRHGRDTTWILRAREAPAHIKENWPGCSWIVEVVTTVISKGKRTERAHHFLTSGSSGDWPDTESPFILDQHSIYWMIIQLL